MTDNNTGSNADNDVIPRIMIVDDEENVLKALRRELESTGLYSVHTFNSPETALAHAEIHRTDLLITDYKMPWMHGLTLLKYVMALQPRIAVILISGNADEALRHSRFNEREMPRLLRKPWQRSELLNEVAGSLADACSEQA